MKGKIFDEIEAFTEKEVELKLTKAHEKMAQDRVFLKRNLYIGNGMSKFSIKIIFRRRETTRRD